MPITVISLAKADYYFLYISQLTPHVGGYIMVEVLLNKVGLIQVNVRMIESLRRNPNEIIL